MCGARNIDGALCAGTCKKLAPAALKKIYWAGKYDDILRNAIWQLKYKKRTELAPLLGILMANKWTEREKNYEPSQFVIVPIPLHPVKMIARGFNQTELIAQSFSQKTHIALATDILHKTKETEAQATTANKADRFRNLRDVFATDASALKKYNGKTIILIDDVATTGATLIHASSALARAGARHIIGLVAAHG